MYGQVPMPRSHDYRFLAEIGRRLTDKRETLGMSQFQTAKKARISPQQLSKYELGLSDPPISTLMRITQVLQMSPTALLIQSMLLAETDKRL
jgi:transcriptional regulator with XRE-family HTH domain